MDIKQKTIVVVDGERLVNYELLKLTQKIQNHHKFKLIIDQGEIDKTGNHSMEESKELIGKSVVINIGEERDFMGTITEVTLGHKDGFHGKLIVKGRSKTILLDSGKFSRSWLHKPLSYIINDVSRNANVDVVVNPENDFTLNYESQYKENNFRFLKRLSKQFNEWLYYDGIQLIFGKPSLNDPIHITYGESITELSLSMALASPSPSLYAYNAVEDAISITKSKDNLDGLNELGAYAYSLSKEVYPEVPVTESTTIVNDKYQLDRAVYKKQAAKSANLHTITAKSSDKRLGVGTVININSAKYNNKTFEEKRYGLYIITAITHTATGGHEYSNEFQAIPGGVNTLPVSKVKLPRSESQIATVVANEDPKNIGRIQVQFHWQDNNMRTDWLRVMSPNAGGSKQHTQNRGYVFVPEIGDQVIVHFLGSDPNKGYVAGSLFTGKTGAGGKDKNAIKQISTRSGHLMEFDDTPNKERITLTDKNQNVICIDTAKENILISAPKTIDILASNINIIASETLNIRAKNKNVLVDENLTTTTGKVTKISSGSDYKVRAANIVEIASKEMKSQADQILKQSNEDMNIASVGGNINKEAEQKINNNSAEQGNLF